MLVVQTEKEFCKDLTGEKKKNHILVLDSIQGKGTSSTRNSLPSHFKAQNYLVIPVAFLVLVFARDYTLLSDKVTRRMVPSPGDTGQRWGTLGGAGRGTKELGSVGTSPVGSSRCP